MRTFLNRNAFEKILISFSQPSSTRHAYLFSFSITHIYTFHIYTSHRLMNIDFFDCLMFFKSTRLFVFFQNFRESFPSLTMKTICLNFFFSYKDLKDIRISFFQKIVFKCSYIYSESIYTQDP